MEWRHFSLPPAAGARMLRDCCCRMKSRPHWLCAALFSACVLSVGARSYDFDKPPFTYWQRQPEDRATRWLQSAPQPAGLGELEFLAHVLKGLEVADSTQLLVFSSTSLQTIVNPSNPRAIYFNDDTSVGFVPGGRIEITSFDPEVGPVFQIFERTFGGNAPTATRSTRCMNCHAGDMTKYLPGLPLESVAINSAGGTLETYRSGAPGHQTPLADRFGGWHLTGRHNLPQTHANLIGQLVNGKLRTVPNEPGQRARLDRYPRPTSDILPHLVHDHQVGFVNLATESLYLSKLLASEPGGLQAPAAAKELDELADRFARYILFADEAKLPAQGIGGDADFIRDFQARARKSPEGVSVREFDLRTRLFRTRCSYMLESSVWAAVPAEVKDRTLAAVKTLVRTAPWLDAEEKRRIAQWLMATQGVSAS